MKIAYIFSDVYKSLQWEWASEELNARKIPHFFIIIDESPPLFIQEMKATGTKVYFIRHKKNYSYFINLIRIIKILKKEKSSVVHTSLPWGNLFGQMAAILTGINKRITTCENASWPHDFKSKKQEWIDRFTYWAASKIICTCDAAYEYLATRWKINQEKLELIYQGIKKEHYEHVSEERIQKMKKELNIRQEDFIVGMVARFEYWKGHIYVLEAMKKIVKNHPNIKLLIFGNKGSEYEKIMSKIKELNLSNNIFHKGIIDDPVTLFNTFHIHIHIPTSKFVETFGLNIIEGMASARTQILTKSGIAFTTAMHLKNSWVVDYCNSDQIAEAIIQLKENPELSKKLATKAQQDAFVYFDNTKKIDEYIDLYK